MSSDVLERRFREAGVPLRLESDRRWFGVRVGRSTSKEWISLSPGDSEVTVMDAEPELRQLLLLVKDTDGLGRRSTQKFLCGQDERNLFAVRVTRYRGPLNRVLDAHEALKPEALRNPERSRRPRMRRGQRRRPPRYRDPGFLRQGDWFFEPRPWIEHDCPGIQRRVRLGFSGGNAHLVDYLLGNPRDLFAAPRPSWMSGGRVFARGFVRHREHRPIHLRCWHLVYPNSAAQAFGGPVD